MKKLISIMLSCTVIVGAFSSCRHHKKEDTTPPSAVAQVGESADEALAEIYRVNYSENGGEAVLNYLYPKVTLDIFKSYNLYDEMVSKTNTGIHSYLELADNIPGMKEIVEKNALNDDQIAGAQKYFVEISNINLADSGVKDQITADDINVVEGYEFKTIFTNTGGLEEDDVEIMVKIEGDGWKNIAVDAETLERYYKGELAE
ncbi:MAG: hypothetical protein NC247_00695 [Ruminococcus flavefaciens]|nr:hypothetical protein [Ruminococcus flavefaciens]MCM1360919.1 hypothetical protein [Clostridiales bacterium]MCM1435595.1 hypothetical protein [Ruminococcus flavefaciens]